MRWTGQRQQWRRIPVFVTCVSLKWNAAHAENEEDRFNGGRAVTQCCSMRGNRPGPHGGGLLSKRTVPSARTKGYLAEVYASLITRKGLEIKGRQGQF